MWKISKRSSYQVSTLLNTSVTDGQIDKNFIRDFEFTFDSESNGDAPALIRQNTQSDIRRIE